MPLARRSALILPLLLARPALAAWPERPLRLIVPFPPGSGTDVLARLLVEPLGRQLGQPLVIDNRPGGNGVVGTDSVARSAPDGNTWVVLSVTNGALVSYLLRRPPYDPIRDFAPISLIAETAYILVVPPSSLAQDLRGFIAQARAARTPMTFSHGNSSAHMASATLARMAGIEMTAVPYRGGPEALTDVIAGRIDSTFTDYAAGMPQIRDGKVRALAVTLGRPFSLAPDIPAVASVLPGYEFKFWFGLSVPAGTPAPIIGRANAALRRVMALPEVAERLARLGFTPLVSTPEEYRAFQEQQQRDMIERAREVGIEQS